MLRRKKKDSIIVLFERHSHQTVKRWSSCISNSILIITQKVIVESIQFVVCYHNIDIVATILYIYKLQQMNLYINWHSYDNSTSMWLRLVNNDNDFFFCKYVSCIVETVCLYRKNRITNYIEIFFGFLSPPAHFLAHSIGK
jgi:hypothetical protein